MTALAPWLTTRQPVKRQGAACHRTMLLKSLQAVGRAGRFKPTGAAKPGAEQQTVSLDQAH